MFMHRKLAALMVVLCCSVLVAGCAKKEMMKGDESSLPSAAPLTQTPAPAETIPAPSAQPLQEQPIQQEPVTDAQALKEQPVASPAIEAALETIYFDFDSFVLSAAARDSLAKNAQYLIKNPALKIQVEGHCDERGADEYNLALGEKRANSVMNYLVTLGVPADRMTTISYGKEKPAVEGHDDAAWAKNRRASFVAQ
jgi:peptidoglycan-associated lipoprotein